MGGFSTLPVGGAPNRTRNPILDEIDRAASNAHATLSPQAQEVVRRTTAAPVPGPGNTMDRSPVEQMPSQPIAGPSGTPRPIGGPPPTDGVPTAPAASVAPTPPPAQPIASPAQTRLNALQAPVEHKHNKFLRGLGYAGDALLTTFAPRAAQVIPGTMLNKQLKLANAENAVTDEQNVLNDQSKRGLEQSQADENAARIPLIGAQTEEANARVPFIHAQTDTELGKPELQQQAADVRQQTADLAAQRQRETVQSALLKAGYEMGPDGTPVAIPRERLPESERAKLDQLDNLGALRNAQAELATANAELARAKAAGVPAQIEATKIKAANAERAHDIALANLGLHRQQFEFQSQGTVNGVAPPGTLLTEGGQPVGTRNAPNVRPTGQERGRADLGTSAQHQLEDMRSIVQNRPDIFGPAAGRKTDFNVWLGSEDPDAARFRTARTILGDHEAGTFGGRSDQTVKNLEAAAGLFKTNPDAILGSLQQLEKANKTFIKAGTVRTVGSEASKSAPVKINSRSEYDRLPSGASYIDTDGNTYTKK